MKRVDKDKVLEVVQWVAPMDTDSWSQGEIERLRDKCDALEASIKLLAGALARNNLIDASDLEDVETNVL